MVKYTATLKKFDSQGEKTGWTYIELTAALAEQLLPSNKKSFRVKGKLDNYAISGVSVLPMGGGDFIMPINATMRRAIGKTKGATVQVILQLDTTPVTICPELVECLADEPAALQYFNKLAPSHQKYYSKWIESAKTEATKAKRIAQAIDGMAKEWDYGQMIRAGKANKL